jgi:hypothetical protein
MSNPSDSAARFGLRCRTHHVDLIIARVEIHEHQVDIVLHALAFDFIGDMG